MADYPEQPGTNQHPLTGKITDISTAGQEYWAAPFRGKVLFYQSCLHGAISGADATLTLKINGTAVTGGTVTVANSGSAAGDVDLAEPTALNEFDKGDAIEIETDGASTGTTAASLTVWVAVT